MSKNRNRKLLYRKLLFHGQQRSIIRKSRFDIVQICVMLLYNIFLHFCLQIKASICSLCPCSEDVLLDLARARLW